MALSGPKFGTTGMPPGQRPLRYPDLESGRLIAAIETEGVRLAWTRAIDCPCVGVNPQTRQPDPNCPNCHGLAIQYFGPENYIPPAEVGALDTVQQALINVSGAAIIRGVISKVSAEQDLYDVLGHWMWGTMMVTVRPENKIGYYDRLVSLDSEMVYFQTINLAANATIIPVRYLCTAVNLVRSETATYREGQDFTLVNGVPTWITGHAPTVATTIVIHYQMHPVWVCTDHPHVLRETTRRRKQTPLISPLGNPTQLPIQGKIRLEFLPVPTSAPGAPP